VLGLNIATSDENTIHDHNLMNSVAVIDIDHRLYIANATPEGKITTYDLEGHPTSTVLVTVPNIVPLSQQRQSLYSIYSRINNITVNRPGIPILKSSQGTTQNPTLPPLLNLSDVVALTNFVTDHLSNFLLTIEPLLKFCSVYPDHPLDATTQSLFRKALSSILITPPVNVAETTQNFNDLISNMSKQGYFSLPFVINYPTLFSQFETMSSDIMTDKMQTITNNDLLVSSTVAPSPTGIVFNNTKGFVISNGLLPPRYASSFVLVCTNNGLVFAYSPLISGKLVLVIDNSPSKSCYNGLTIADNKLYLADFFNRRIDVYDFNFKYLKGFPFIDYQLPNNFAPHNIVNIGDQLYVLYSEIDPQNFNKDKPGEGSGFVSIFNFDGTFVKRFISQGHLNSPWSLIVAPINFNEFSNQLLIANHGDGQINAYDLTGNHLGSLKTKRNRNLKIDGLSGLFSHSNLVFFSAAPNQGKGGVIGKILKKC